MSELFIPGNNITVANINGTPTNTLVVNAGTSTNTAIARFSGTVGKTLTNSTVLVDGTGNLTGLGTINGTIIANIVSNTGTSTNTAIAVFSGTVGKTLINSTVLVDGTGNLTGVGTVNGNPVSTGTNTGDVTLTVIGAVPNANGASLTGQVLSLQPANTLNGGVTTSGAQAFGGQKDFSNGGITVGVPIGGMTNLLIGNAGYYRTSAGISVTWDPNSLLFVAPFTGGTITCERIGNRIFIGITGVPPTPVGGGGNIISSNIGVIPVPFRPSVIRGVFALVINGNTPPNPPYTVVAGFCLLDTSGTLSFGSSQVNNQIYQGIQTNGILNNFNGPNGCGLIAQTLVFEA